MLVALWSVCLVLGGCSSSRYVQVSSPQNSESPAVVPGDYVRVTMKSGEVHRLKVAAADLDTIAGDDQDSRHSGRSLEIAMADVQKLELLTARDISAGKTTGLVLGIIAAVAAIAFAAFVIDCPTCGSD